MDSTGVAVDQKETDNFRKHLEPFPHLFQIQGYADLKIARLNSIRDRVRAERTEIEEKTGEAGYGRMQRSRDSNVIAFTSFQLDDYDTAMSESERVLQVDPDNIVTLANLAVFAWERGSRVEAEERLQGLKKLSNRPDFADRCVEAKAELAYCYSRLGPSYTGLAVRQFEEVVKLRPLVYDWKLGLGMTLTRAIRFNQRMSHAITEENAEQKAEQAVNLFLDVKGNAEDTLKAHAAAQLGLLLTSHTGDSSLQDFAECLCRSQSVTAQQCFEDALRLAPKDSSILTKCGQFFFRQKNYDTSRMVLEKSISIRPSTTAHLTMGMNFSRIVYNDKRASRTHDIKMLAEKAIDHFQRSIDLAHGDNDTARSHLARFYMTLEDYPSALVQFKLVMGQEKAINSPADRITAYELGGQCYLRMSELEQDHQKKRELKDEAHKLLKVALSFQCHYARKTPMLKAYFGKEWHSFHTLMTELQNDAAFSNREREKERARLLHMMGEYAKSLQIIKDISQYTSKEATDPEFLQMKLQCYMGMKQYDEAVVFLRILDMTNQRQAVQNWKELWAQTHILAAKQALLAHENLSDTNASFEIAQAYFVLAFDSLRAHAKCGNSDLPDTIATYTEDEGDGESSMFEWHVMILCDPYDVDSGVEHKAAAIKKTLKDVCGLRVTCMSDDVHPADQEYMETLNNVQKSLLAIVMVSEEDQQDEKFSKLFIAPTLDIIDASDSCLQGLLELTVDSDRPPYSPANTPVNAATGTVNRAGGCMRKGVKLTSGWPSFHCPPALLGPCGNDSSAAENVEVSVFKKEEILNVCDLFCAMLGVSIKEYS